jgi:hypothetical protein
MPDLIIRSFWHCQSFDTFEAKVPSSTGGVYIVTFGPVPFGPTQRDWQCECKGFKFRKSCRHVKEARKLRCGWSQFQDGGDVVRTKKGGDPQCPDCRGEVGAFDWGV